MAGGGRVKDVDKGLAATIKRVRKGSFGATLRVGIIGEEADKEHDGGLTVAELGEIHEFGLGGMPQRSFIGGWFDEQADEHRDQIRKVAQAVIAGKLDSWDQGLERLGVLFVAQVQKRMTEGIDPPSVVDGRVIRLTDTGVLKSSITYKVVKS